jgi:hypothetical protein
MPCSEEKKCPFNVDAFMKELKEIHPEINEKCIPSLLNLFKKHNSQKEDCCDQEDIKCCTTSCKEEVVSNTEVVETNKEVVECCQDSCKSQEVCEELKCCDELPKKENCCLEKECCK